MPYWVLIEIINAAYHGFRFSDIVNISWQNWLKPILLRYISLAQQNLRYIADFVAILGIIARNMPMWQRDRNMAKKFVVLMIIIAISGSLPVKNLSKETVLATFPKPMKNWKNLIKWNFLQKSLYLFAGMSCFFHAIHF